MSRRTIALIVGLALLATGIAGCAATEIEAGGDISNGGDNGNSSAGVSEINWFTDWGEALGQAQTENKPMHIYFYTDVCPSCRKLEQTTYTDGELITYLNANFINLKNNAGRSTLYRRYGINAVPTIVFNTPDGYDEKYEISKFIGYRTAERFFPEAQKALDTWQP